MKESRRGRPRNSDTELPTEEMGKRLTAARKRLGLTQIEVSERLGIHEQSYYQIERGFLTAWSTDRTIQLAKAIGCDPSEIDPRIRPLPSSAACAPTLSLYAATDGEIHAESRIDRDCLHAAGISAQLRLLINPTDLARLVEAGVKNLIVRLPEKSARPELAREESAEYGSPDGVEQ